MQSAFKNPDPKPEQKQLPLQDVILCAHPLTILDNFPACSILVNEVSDIKRFPLNDSPRLSPAAWPDLIRLSLVRKQFKGNLPPKFCYLSGFFKKLQFLPALVFLFAVEYFTICRLLPIVVFVPADHSNTSPSSSSAPGAASWPGSAPA